MTLFEKATDLQLRLESASAADAGDELLTRGRVLRQDLVAAAEHFEGVQSYRAEIDQTDELPIDGKIVRQGIGRFRAALSTNGPRAFQQQAAQTLLDSLSAQSKRLDRWVRSTWIMSFDSAESLLTRANSGELHGSPAQRIKATGRSKTISAAMKVDPIHERARLEEILQATTLTGCLKRIDQLTEELREAIDAIDSEEAAMPQEVRDVLKRVTSDAGFPLPEVTPEVLNALEAAGVLHDLVVRRR